MFFALLLVAMQSAAAPAGKAVDAARKHHRANEQRILAELADFLADVAGEAFCELGEIRLRMGDLPTAETMFGEAHARGRDPHGDAQAYPSKLTA